MLLGWTPTLVVRAGLPAPLGYAALLWINIGGIAGSFAIGWLCDRVGVRNAMLGAYLIMAGSLYLFSNALNAQSIVPIAAFAGFAVLGVQFALFGVAPRLYPPTHRGAGVGSALAAGRVGSVFGPVIAGNLLGAGLSESGVLLIMAPVAILAGLALVALTIVARHSFAVTSVLAVQDAPHGGPIPEIGESGARDGDAAA